MSGGCGGGISVSDRWPLTTKTVKLELLQSGSPSNAVAAGSVLPADNNAAFRGVFHSKGTVRLDCGFLCAMVARRAAAPCQQKRGVVGNAA